MIESCGSSLGKQLIILYFPPFLSVSTTVNSTYLPIPSAKSLTSVLIISSFSFSIIRDFPPQLINAFSLVRKKSLSLLHEDRKVKENTIKKVFS